MSIALQNRIEALERRIAALERMFSDSPPVVVSGQPQFEKTGTLKLPEKRKPNA